MQTTTPLPPAPRAPEPSFHAGEVAEQEQVGLAERMARIGPQVFRPELPEQHRAFFPLLPFVVVGSVDAAGQPSASLLTGAPGFAHSPDPRQLRLDALPLPGDPLRDNLQLGASLGLLGLQPHTRRRNRANGNVAALDGRGFTLDIAQSFGNCPKYIHPREIVLADAAASPAPAPRVASALDAEMRALLARADTFFIASAHPAAAGLEPSTLRAHGVDVSHRGGPRGFIQPAADGSFSVPDYSGNNFFNTLGNLRLNPAAGLLFVDWASGDLLQLDVRAFVGSAPEDEPEGPADTGRVLRFELQRARFFPGASRLRVAAR